MKSGDELGRYRIEAELGRGGMGVVYEAYDTRLARRVALKVLPPGADAIATERMLREARAAAAFEHANAVVVFDVGEVDEKAFIAMELVRGRTMRFYLDDPDLPVERRIRWLVDVARALAAAHRAGLVHRDVKPDNVMIREDGAVKVLDFGIARRAHVDVDPSAPTESGEAALPTLTQQGLVVGTPLYASPEQLRGETTDGRSDQFSWGVVAYELLTGKPPWSRGAGAVTLISQVLSADPKPLPEILATLPKRVATTVHRALSKRPEDRFPTIDQAADAIEPFAEASSRSETLREAPPARGRPVLRGVIYAFAGIGVLFAGCVGIAALTGHASIDVRGEKDAGLAPQVVQGLACDDAKVEGEGATPEIAHALGLGACARAASELGVDWKAPAPAPKLGVTAKLAAGHADVTLEVAGRSSTGSAATPLDALAAALPALTKQLAAPEPTPQEIRAWGAKDAASARRIERVWRQIVLDITPDADRLVHDLVESDPDTPWPHAFAALVYSRGTENQQAERKKAIELAPRLTHARADGLVGLMQFLGTDADRVEGLRRMRASYADDPNDLDIAGLYAAVAVASGTEEGYAVVDRLYDRSPTRSLVPLQNAVTAAWDRNLDRDDRYIGKLVATLPEIVARPIAVRHLVMMGKLIEARAALAFGEKLGSAGKSVDATDLQSSRVLVELAAFEPKAARDLAEPMLADPRSQVWMYGVEATIASYWLEGRADEALERELYAVERLKGVGELAVAEKRLEYAGHLARLGRPRLPDAEVVAAEKTVTDSTLVPAPVRAMFRANSARIRAGAKPNKKDVEALVVEIEGQAAAIGAGDPRARDAMLLATLPLVRLVRGDDAAAKRWRDTSRAPSWARVALAFDAGAALEKVGALDEARDAYSITASPENAYQSPLWLMAAHVRLADIERSAGHLADAAKHQAIVDRLWNKADPALLALAKER